MSFSTETYAGTGTQATRALALSGDQSAKFVVIAGATDIWSLEIQITKEADFATHPGYTNISGNELGRLNGQVAAIRLNIGTNVSTAIKLQTNKE